MVDLVDPSIHPERNFIGPCELTDEIVEFDTVRMPKAVMKRPADRNLLDEYKQMIQKDAIEIQTSLEDDHEYGRDLHRRYHGIRHMVLKQRKIIHRSKCSPGTLLSFTHANTVEYHYFNGSDVWVLVQERIPQVLVKESVSANIGKLDLDSFRGFVNFLSGTGQKVKEHSFPGFFHNHEISDEGLDISISCSIFARCAQCRKWINRLNKCVIGQNDNLGFRSSDILGLHSCTEVSYREIASITAHNATNSH